MKYQKISELLNEKVDLPSKFMAKSGLKKIINQIAHTQIQKKLSLQPI